MRIFSALLLSLATVLPAHALTAQQVVEREVVIQNPDGTETLMREPATEVAPGDRVIYSVQFTNDTAEPADDLVLTQPVPEAVVFIDGSADRAGAALTVSVDGGLTFGPRGAAMVQRDGAMVRASASDITHVRWTLLGELAPGASDTVLYKGVLQ